MRAGNVLTLDDSAVIRKRSRCGTSVESVKR